jgi:phenylpyruvate tautomerase PptA (4-oxalocrotonate tautomerase family)
MPILDIEIVSAAPDAIAPGLAQALADELGDAFGAEAGKVWVRLRALPAAHYAENNATAPAPVFVTVLASAPPAGKQLQERIESITSIVAVHLERSRENVHVVFEPAARGRIAFGGRLVE